MSLGIRGIPWEGNSHEMSGWLPGRGETKPLFPVSRLDPSSTHVPCSTLATLVKSKSLEPPDFELEPPKLWTKETLLF